MAIGARTTLLVLLLLGARVVLGEGGGGRARDFSSCAGCGHAGAYAARAADPPAAARAARGGKNRAAARLLDAVPEPAWTLPSAAALAEQGSPLAVGDRWRLVEALGIARESLWNPYQQNTLKADRPIYGRDWFLNLSLESRSSFEFGRHAQRSGSAGAGAPAHGEVRERFAREAIGTALSLSKGSTAFRPPQWQFRIRTELRYGGGAARVARLRGADPGQSQGSAQRLGLRELFVEKYLRTRSERFDFDAVRVGVQPFSADFRGFLLHDEQPAIRLFGNAAGNRFQYNAAWLRLRGRDAGSDLNEFAPRREDVFAANLYAQDLPAPGFTLQATALYDRARGRAKARSFSAAAAPGPAARPAPPRAPARGVVYLGVSGDGHLDRLNLSFSAYAARGSERAAGAAEQRVRAHFGAIEASIDVDWYRLKAYAAVVSGDRDASDRRAEGFTAIRENAHFGAAEDGFLAREALPLGEGGSALGLGAGGLLPSLEAADRSAGPSFVHAGLRRAGVGADFDVLPELRLSLNAEHLEFDAPSLFASSPRSGPGRRRAAVDRRIGEQLSAALVYRPLFINNIAIRASISALAPGAGLRELLAPGSASALYAGRIALVLSY